MRILLLFIFMVGTIHELSLQASLIDSMSNVTSWTAENDANAFGKISSYTENNKVSLNFNVNFSNGQWAQVSKKFSGLDLSAGNNLKFWYKANGGSSIKIRFGMHKTNEGEVTTVIADNQWHQATINLMNNPWNRGDMKIATPLKFVFMGSGNGTIILDKLELYSGTTNVKIVDTLDNSSYHYGWSPSVNNNNQLTLSTVEGLSNQGKAIMLSYKFIDGDYVLIERSFNINLISGDFLKFRIKSNGQINHLAVYLSDTKDWNNISVTYGKFFYSLIGSAHDWITITLAANELQYISSDNPAQRINFNANQVEKVAFRINKGNNSSHANMILSDFAIDNTIDFQKEYGANNIVQELQIDNNPFSPNNDDWKDTCQFTYKLSKSANIRLKLYNLKGNLIKEINMGSQSPGLETPIIWNGQNDSNQIVHNGMYIYYLQAIAREGNDKIKGVVGVVK